MAIRAKKVQIPMWSCSKDFFCSIEECFVQYLDKMEKIFSLLEKVLKSYYFSSRSSYTQTCKLTRIVSRPFGTRSLCHLA